MPDLRDYLTPGIRKMSDVFSSHVSSSHGVSSSPSIDEDDDYFVVIDGVDGETIRKWLAVTMPENWTLNVSMIGDKYVVHPLTFAAAVVVHFRWN